MILQEQMGACIHNELIYVSWPYWILKGFPLRIDFWYFSVGLMKLRQCYSRLEV